MSLQISPSESAQTGAWSRAADPTAAAAQAPTPKVDQQAVKVDTFPSTPPRDSFEAMGVASDVYDKLAAKGQHLHFALDGSGKLTVELQDLSGHTISRVSPSQVLAIAGGEDLR